MVIHDGFRPLEWADFMPAPEYQNVMLDAHRYQCFTDEDRKRDATIRSLPARHERKQHLDEKQHQLPSIVGEWSSALPPDSLGGRSGLPPTGQARLRRRRAARLRDHPRLVLLDLKAEESSAWSFRDCV